MGDVSNIEYLQRVEQSRKKRLGIKAETLLGLTDKEQDQIRKLESRAYGYSNKKLQKKLRAEAMSKDLRRWF